MSRINLLPPEVRKARANQKLARSISLFGILAAVLLGGLYLIRTWQVFTLNNELGSVRTEQAAVQSEIDAYAEVAADQAAITYGRNVVAALLAGEVSWSEQMLHFASTVPPGFALSSLSGSLSGEPGLPVIGTLSWTATASTYASTETWLIRLDAQEGWANGWVTSVADSDGSLAVSGSVDLTPLAVTPRGGGAA